MPPHCDSLDGPVVTAAREALASQDVDRILPFVHADAEPEVCEAFSLASAARVGGSAAQEVADRYFFETVVRLHRLGEGAPFAGLKPAGLDVGPVIPLAEAAIADDDPTELIDFLTGALRGEVLSRFERLRDARSDAHDGVAAARRLVDATLELEVWAHHLYQALGSTAHESPQR